MKTLREIAKEIGGLPSGSWYTVRTSDLIRAKREMCGSIVEPWTAVDEIMEQIVGSAYEIQVVDEPSAHTVTFKKLIWPLQSGQRTYVSPDRRHLFELLPTGFYRKLP